MTALASDLNERVIPTEPQMRCLRAAPIPNLVAARRGTRFALLQDAPMPMRFLITGHPAPASAA